jgi:predicted RNA binding protein YcfA (HicA-like mRNA interferase family)
MTGQPVEDRSIAKAVKRTGKNRGFRADRRLGTHRQMERPEYPFFHLTKNCSVV